MKIALDRITRSALIVLVRVFDRDGSVSWEVVAAVDTGASMVILPRLAAETLGYDLDTAPAERFILGDAVLEAPRIRLHRMDIEGASAEDVEAICHDFPDECPMEALVGLSFLTRFRVAFDFDAWEMELVPRA